VLQPVSEIGWRSHSFLRLVVFSSACLQDVRGAVAQGQFEVAHFSTLSMIAEIAGINSSRGSGSLVWLDDSCTADPFISIPSDLAATLDEILVLVGRAANRADWDVITARSSSLFDDLAQELVLGGQFPDIRADDGIYRAISLARGAMQAVETLGLPELVPPGWKRGGSGAD